MSYEERFCKNVSHKGVVVLGDSAGAHFGIPRVWAIPHESWWSDFWSYDPVFAISNEMDWPLCSWATGNKKKKKKKDDESTKKK